MMHDLFIAFWFFLPAGLANMFPVFAAKLPFLRRFSYPLDFNISVDGKRLLGPHKTIRGLVTGILVGIIVVAVQKDLYVNWDSLHTYLSVDYAALNPLLLGGLLGFGAIAGDAVKSYFKRLRNIPSGEPWLFFDQVDYIIGGILCTFWYAPLSVTQYAYVVIMYIALHFLFNLLGYVTGVRQKAL